MKNGYLKYWPVIAAAAAVGIITVMNVLPYNGNITAFFHLDTLVNESKQVPPGFVVLQVPAYDGAHYYQDARNMPLMFQPARWNELTTQSTTSYSYQRWLLPFLAFVLSAGQEPLLPYAFLFIHLASLLGTAALVWKATKKPLYTIAAALCPAAMVGLHFSLAEPLTLFILVAFLVRFVRFGRLTWIDIALLSLLPLCREVNVLFVGVVWLYLLANKRWRDAALVLIPFGAFFALHGWIYAIFHEFPFLMSTGKSTLPFEALFTLIFGGYGYNRLTVTSIPLALLFVLPGLCWTLWLIIKKKDRSFLTWGSLAFLLLMCTMPDHIWGSITSIGRVITPVYPLMLLLGAREDTRIARAIGAATLIIGVGAGITLALLPHPYILS